MLFIIIKGLAFGLESRGLFAIIVRKGTSWALKMHTPVHCTASEGRASPSPIHGPVSGACLRLQYVAPTRSLTVFARYITR